MSNAYHALVLNLHQPAGNLDWLLEHKEWEAKEILYALDRMPRILWGYEDVARVHLSLSGTLLETLNNPVFQERTYGIIKSGDLLWHLQNTQLFDILGTAYYHPVLPLTPKADWQAQLNRWLDIARHVFWREHFDGFWCPEMAFTMELIPYLKKLGYRYVLVDSHYVDPVDKMSWEEIRYMPHIARYQGQEIIVVVRDRELSDAQESGMEYSWFAKEIHERTQWCDFPPLVTTATDGDNGGWFRNTSEQANFWDVFYRTLLEQARQNPKAIRPTFIHHYLEQYGAYGEVTVRTGAWNTGWHHGADFMQWIGSQAQKQALQRVRDASLDFHAACEQAIKAQASEAVWQQLQAAHWHLLRAETSCHFYWGEAWVCRAHDDLDAVWAHLYNASH